MTALDTRTARRRSAAPGASRPASAVTVLVTAWAHFMVTLDALVVVTALPSVHRDLSGNFDTLHWTVNDSNTAFAAGIIAAAVGDRIGGRRLYTFGLGLFTAASAACALAPSATALIGFRVLQGVGAAIVVPPGLTLLTSAFPAQRHGGRRLGRDRRPGGRCRAADRRRRHPGATWHWIFWVNVPISLAAAIGTRLVLPESLARSGRHHGGPALRRVRSGLREVG